MARNYGLRPFKFSGPDHEPFPYTPPVLSAARRRPRSHNALTNLAVWTFVAAVLAFGALSMVGSRPLAEGRSIAAVR